MRSAKIGVYKNVKSYFVYHDCLIYARGKCIYVVSPKGEIKLFELEENDQHEISSVFVQENNLYALLKNRSLDPIPATEKKAVHASGNTPAIAPTEDMWLVYHFDNPTFERLYGLKNPTQKGEFFFLKDLKGIIIPFKKGILRIERGIIHCYLTMLRESIWSFNLSQLPGWANLSAIRKGASFYRVVGVFDSMLFLRLGNNTLLAFDWLKGLLLQYLILPDLLDLDKKTSNIVSNSDVHIDFAKGKLVILSDRYYFEIDLLTFRSTIRKDFGPSFLKDWRIRKSNLLPDGNLGFIGAPENTTEETGVGIFNTHTAEISWYDEGLPFGGYIRYLNPPQTGGNRLYVLDTKYMLHIYEHPVK
jgi:hypothetical protein